MKKTTLEMLEVSGCGDLAMMERAIPKLVNGLLPH